MILSRKIKQKITLFVPLLSPAGDTPRVVADAQKQRVKRQYGMRTLFSNRFFCPAVRYLCKKFLWLKTL